MCWCLDSSLLLPWLVVRWLACVGWFLRWLVRSFVGWLVGALVGLCVGWLIE